MRSRRMQPVARHAEQKEQDAVRLFVTAQQALGEAEQQLQQLLTYREEYAAGNTAAAQSGQRMQQVRNFQAFIDSLGKAIAQAHLNIESKKQVCERYRQAWLKTRSRSQALNLVVEKYQLDERRQQEQQEQKEQDEHAQRIGFKPAST